MQRRVIEPRPGWRETVVSQGLVYHETEWPDGSTRPYWTESAYYSFTAAQIEELETATAALFELCIAAGDYAIEHRLFEKMAIPDWAVPRVVETWESEPPSVYARFDLRYDGSGPPKLLEFNADTPTALVESAVVQWFWLEDVMPGSDQFNSVHERLLEAWRRQMPAGQTIHFAWTEAETSGEDYMNVVYLEETARQAGYPTRNLIIENVGFDPVKGFVGVEGEPIEMLFKLYPWEWIVHERFAGPCLARMGTGPGRTQWIEPIYKMLWSNKALLPILWEIAPGHPNLLPAYFEADGHPLEDFVRKPIFAREGANLTIRVGGETVAVTGGGYGEEGYVVQAVDLLPSFDGNHPVIGSWLVDGEPAGIGIRESDGFVTDNLSRFVPHAIEG